MPGTSTRNELGSVSEARRPYAGGVTGSYSPTTISVGIRLRTAFRSRRGQPLGRCERTCLAERDLVLAVHREVHAVAEGFGGVAAVEHEGGDALVALAPSELLDQGR